MKVVLTGSPSAGKTTLIRRLEALGFPVVHEQATAVINDRAACPSTDHEHFQFEVLRRQRLAEGRLGEAPLLFLDRGSYDAVPYRVIYGRKVPDFIAALQPGAYDVCFLLDALEWVDDGVRYETAEFSRDIQPYFARVYENNDIPVVRVPVMSPEDRLTFILHHVGRAMRRNLTAVCKANVPAHEGLIHNNERQKRRWHTIPSAGATSCSVPSLELAEVS